MIMIMGMICVTNAIGLTGMMSQCWCDSCDCSMDCTVFQPRETLGLGRDRYVHLLVACPELGRGL